MKSDVLSREVFQLSIRDLLPAIRAAGFDMSESEAKATVRLRGKNEDTTTPASSQKVQMKTTSDEGLIGKLPILSGLPARWRNWWVRGFSTFIMLFAFAVILYLGPVAVIFLTIVIQSKCYQEIVDIGYSQYKKHKLPLFRTLQWYVLAVSNIFILTETLRDHFQQYLEQDTFLFLMVRHNRLISFMLYVIAFVVFVLTLKKDFYMVQFVLFGWTHLALLILVSQCYLTIQNILTGMIWFMAPVMMVICNDVMAYVFGFFFGRTSLIKLSPKKTWEGFIGGGLATVIFGYLFSCFLCLFQYFVCPMQYDQAAGALKAGCEPSYLFIWTEYQVPTIIQAPLSLIGLDFSVIHMYPFQLHALVLASFSSLIAPFGGFFASGFKRAFNIKDFGDTIPGHGGLMDRFDCQLLMASFTYVYIYSFARLPSPDRLLDQVFALSPDKQLKVYQVLQESLRSQGLI